MSFGSVMGRRSSVIVLGAVLAYLYCFLAVSGHFCAGKCFNLEVAVVGAVVIGFPLAFCHALLQFLLSVLLRRIWKAAVRHEWILLNLPVVLLLLVSIAGWFRAATVAFDTFVCRPKPKSVRITQFGRSQGIGEDLNLGLAFELKSGDFGRILSNGGFVLIQDPTNTDLLSLNRRQIRGESCVGVNWDSVGFHYAGTNSLRRHLFASSNFTTGYFFICGHPDHLMKDEDLSRADRP